MKTTTTHGELHYKQSAPKTEPSIKSKSAEHKTKASFKIPTSIWSLKSVWCNLKFQTFTSKYGVFFLKPLNLYVRPVPGTFMWNLLTLMWNLDLKPLCGTFTRNLSVKFLSGTFMTNLSRNVYVENLYVELREPELFCGTFLRNRGTFICGTWELVKVEPLCGTWGTWPSMWNLNF